MSKTVPLKNTAPVKVMKSAETLPAPKAKREYGDFDAFVANADKLSAFFNSVFKEEEELGEVEFKWIERLQHHAPDELKRARQEIERAKRMVQLARYPLAEFPKARKRLAEFKRDEKWYNRKELYDIKGRGKRQQWTLSRRVVSEQIALLLASFQNARPGTPKVFGRMLTEEVYANNPNACVLESACRYVRREKDFPPSIAEVLKAIDKESNAWCDRWETLDCNIDKVQQGLEKYIADTEAQIAVAEAKLAEREAKAKAEEEKWRLRREAYERIPEGERWAYEQGRRMRSDAYRYKDGTMPPMPSLYEEEGHEREAEAYQAGLDGKEIPGLEVPGAASG